MQIVIPMAGLGQRFRDAGYALPKPLIPVDGIPMVARVVQDLPSATRTVFVVHPEHVEMFGIDRMLTNYFRKAHVIVTPGLTEGQACSVRLAGPALDPNEDVCVAACDNTHLYDPLRFQQTSGNSDCLIWTYRREPRVLVKPQWYGWVKTDGTDRVIGVSVKQPISDNPISDHVVSGAFWFRTARLMCDGIDALVASNQRVNNEFYLDAVPDLLVRQGRDVRVFEVEKYIGWGTPADLEDYNCWSRYVRRTCDRAA